MEFHRNICESEFKIFSSLFSALKKPYLVISNLAHLLLPSQDILVNAKPKELNYLRFSIWYASHYSVPLIPFSHGVLYYKR